MTKTESKRLMDLSKQFRRRAKTAENWSKKNARSLAFKDLGEALINASMAATYIEAACQLERLVSTFKSQK